MAPHASNDAPPAGASTHDHRRPQSSNPSAADISPRKRDVMIFSDFDGTIFHQDTGHILFDRHGCGSAQRAALDRQITTGERSFRDVSEEMWASLSVRFDDALAAMRERLQMDEGFREFHGWCVAQRIPFNVISAGLKPILRRVLDEFLGAKQARHIDIIANDAAIAADGTSWKPLWRHDTPLGHDKAATIQEYRALAAAADGTVPLVIFIGDGVSDLAAAREADVLFARRGLRLEEFCLHHRIPHIAFDSFRDVRREIERIVFAAEEDDATPPRDAAGARENVGSAPQPAKL